MSSLARRFLSDPERQSIEACVREVETTTSGEIVPMVVSSSYHYPMAPMIGALIVSVLAAAAVTALVGLQEAWQGFGVYDLVRRLGSRRTVRRLPAQRLR